MITTALGWTYVQDCCIIHEDLGALPKNDGGEKLVQLNPKYVVLLDAKPRRLKNNAKIADRFAPCYNAADWADTTYVEGHPDLVRLYKNNTIVAVIAAWVGRSGGFVAVPGRQR